MVAPRRTGVRDLSRSTILWQDLLRKTLVPPLVPARGALVACLTGLVTLTSTRIYDLHYSTYTRVPGSVSIHNTSRLGLWLFGTWTDRQSAQYIIIAMFVRM